MENDTHILISAGESSGDRLGTGLIADLNKAFENGAGSLRFSGMGGPLMRAVTSGLLGFPERSAAGLIELAPGLGDLARRLAKISMDIRRDPPDIAVLIDFPDFNMLLARQLYRLNIPVIYYAAPQCWAWRKARVQALKRYCTRLALLFPFEVDWYRAQGLLADYVGHPLAHPLPEWRGREHTHDTARIGIFPGSRAHEIETILPIQLQAARVLDALRPGRVRFQIHASPQQKTLTASIIRAQRSPIELAEDSSPACDLAWCAAGTVTLELALAGIPCILTHRLHPISYTLARRFIQTPHAGLPNIILNRPVAPELIQENCRPASIVHWSARLLQNGARRQAMLAGWRELREHFTNRPPALSAADCVMQTLDSGHMKRRTA